MAAGGMVAVAALIEVEVDVVVGVAAPMGPEGPGFVGPSGNDAPLAITPK